MKSFPVRASQLRRLAVAVVACGLAAGLIGVAMAWLLEGFEWLFYGVDAASLPERVSQAPAWRRVAAPALAGLIAGAAWWWERSTGGVVSVEQVVAESASPGARRSLGSLTRRMGIFRPFFDAVLQVLTVGGGNSVGREGAPRLAAGAIAVKVTQWLGVEDAWLGPLAASAAGAGLAAMYNAPLGGAAYALEIVMLTGMRRRGFLVALPVSIVATVVSWIHSHGDAAIVLPGENSQWSHPNFANVSGAAWAVVAVLAVLVVAGAAGWCARATWAWLRKHRVPNSWQLPLAIAAAGTATGIVSLWLPVIPGNGKDAFQAAVAVPASAAAVGLLLGVIALKPLLTGFTLAGGATGGLLAPSFSLGACAGAFCGLVATWSGADVNVSLLAVLGAAVTLGVTQKAPFFAAIFVWELTQAPVWTLPVLLLACYTTARFTR